MRGGSFLSKGRRSRRARRVPTGASASWGEEALSLFLPPLLPLTSTLSSLHCFPSRIRDGTAQSHHDGSLHACTTAHPTETSEIHALHTRLGYCFRSRCRESVRNLLLAPCFSSAVCRRLRRALHVKASQDRADIRPTRKSELLVSFSDCYRSRVDGWRWPRRVCARRSRLRHLREEVLDLGLPAEGHLDFI